MNEKVNQIAKELALQLKKSFKGFEGLYVFGSQINEKLSNGSDIDIVAIIDAKDKKVRWAIWDIILRMEHEYNILFDLHPMTMEELKKNDVFYNEVVNKGVFYDAA